jgi:hypothetical protein
VKERAGLAGCPHVLISRSGKERKIGAEFLNNLLPSSVFKLYNLRLKTDVSREKSIFSYHCTSLHFLRRVRICAKPITLPRAPRFAFRKPQRYDCKFIPQSSTRPDQVYNRSCKYLVPLRAISPRATRTRRLNHPLQRNHIHQSIRPPRTGDSTILGTKHLGK